MSIFTVKYKVKKVTVDGQHKFVPIERKALFGIGFWTECEDWSQIEKNLEGERHIGLETDSTLTVIRGFIDERTHKAPENEYYHSEAE